MSTLIIISGGQTGVDRAALDVAIQYGILHAGWCPAGRRAEDGILSRKYRLLETKTSNYPERTSKNVVESDGTLIIYKDELSGGTALTVNLAKQHQKPFYLLNLSEPFEIQSFISWKQNKNISRLNIAGPRESSSPGIYKEATVIINQILEYLL